MQRPKNSRLAEQIRQIKSLLVDFKKARTKCIDLAAQLRIDLNKQNFYPTTERSTLMKCQLLDLKGLIQLKNSLVNILGQLFEKEREFAYQKQKRQAQQILEIQNKALGLQSMRSSKRESNMNETQSVFNSMRSSKMSEINSSRKIQIPFYKVDPQVVESVEYKLDRVSKYIASLKKSIRNASENPSTKFKTKEYLLQQEPYVKAKQELERYLMREEEFEKIFSKTIKNEIQKYFKNNATLTSEGDYYLVKVPKPKVKEEEKITPNPALPDETINMKKGLSTYSETYARAQAKAEADFEEIKVELERKTQNMAQLFSQMNEVVQKGNERMSELRQKRKEAFKKDDELWDEL